jgi:hypothetical protein
MKNKKLILALLCIVWCVLCVDVRAQEYPATECLDTFPQQCGELTQVASNTIVVKKKAVSVPAGCTDPAPGTVLGGNSTINDTTSDCSINGWICWEGTGHSVTWAETCTTTTVSSISIYTDGISGVHMKAVLYNSDNSKVLNGDTDSTLTTGWSAGWHTLSFSTPPIVTKGNTYKVGYMVDGAGGNTVSQNSATGSINVQTGLTYPTAPDLLSNNIWYTSTFAIRIVK